MIFISSINIRYLKILFVSWQEYLKKKKLIKIITYKCYIINFKLHNNEMGNLITKSHRDKMSVNITYKEIHWRDKIIGTFKITNNITYETILCFFLKNLKFYL